MCVYTSAYTRSWAYINNMQNSKKNIRKSK